MTEYDYFKAAIERADSRGTMKDEGRRDPAFDDHAKQITISAGYSGFVSVLTFNDDGTLESISAWE
jgi:hypothetical protein